MQRMICNKCGYSVSIDNYKTMADDKFKCEMCGSIGIDNFKIFSHTGMLLRGDVHERKMSSLVSQLYAQAKQEEQKQAAEKAEIERLAKEKRDREAAEQKAKENEKQRQASIHKKFMETPKQIKTRKDVSEMWEYKVIYIEHEMCVPVGYNEAKVERVLNQYGVLGWELVQVENQTFYFKKKV